MTFHSKVLAHTSSRLENRYILLFWLIFQLPVECFWSKWSKGTTTDQDLLSGPIIKSLWPSVQKFWPVQKIWRSDGRLDKRTDGHPKSIGHKPFGLGPKNEPSVLHLSYELLHIYFDTWQFDKYHDKYIYGYVILMVIPISEQLIFTW